MMRHILTPSQPPCYIRDDTGKLTYNMLTIIIGETNVTRHKQTELRADQDAYGQIYQALLEGREAQEIMERDDGLIYAGEPADYFAPYRHWPTAEKCAMRAVRGRVLDVGCGAGRVSLHLQARGHDVVAIDESPLAIEVV